MLVQIFLHSTRKSQRRTSELSPQLASLTPEVRARKSWRGFGVWTLQATVKEVNTSTNVSGLFCLVICSDGVYSVQDKLV